MRVPISALGVENWSLLRKCFQSMYATCWDTKSWITNTHETILAHVKQFLFSHAFCYLLKECGHLACLKCSKIQATVAVMSQNVGNYDIISDYYIRNKLWILLIHQIQSRTLHRESNAKKQIRSPETNVKHFSKTQIIRLGFCHHLWMTCCKS